MFRVAWAALVLSATTVRPVAGGEPNLLAEVTRDVVSAVAGHRTRQLPAATAVSPAGPSRSTSPRPQTKSAISATIPSAISNPITPSAMPEARQCRLAKP